MVFSQLRRTKLASEVYTIFKQKAMSGINYDTTTLAVMLVTDYTVNGTAHSTSTDVSAAEVSGTGYTAGGLAVAGTVTLDTADDEGVLDLADATWASSTISAEGAIVYITSGASTTDFLVCWIDFGSAKSSSNGNFTIQWSTEGVINLT
jgi:hypothetical protein